MSDDEFVREATERLADLVEQPFNEPDAGPQWGAAGEPDAFLVAGKTAFVLKCRTATHIAALHHAIRGLKARVSQARETVVDQGITRQRNPSNARVGHRIGAQTGMDVIWKAFGR